MLGALGATLSGLVGKMFSSKMSGGGISGPEPSRNVTVPNYNVTYTLPQAEAILSQQQMQSGYQNLHKMYDQMQNAYDTYCGMQVFRNGVRVQPAVDPVVEELWKSYGEDNPAPINVTGVTGMMFASASAWPWPGHTIPSVPTPGWNTP